MGKDEEKEHNVGGGTAGRKVGSRARHEEGSTKARRAQRGPWE